MANGEWIYDGDIYPAWLLCPFQDEYLVVADWPLDGVLPAIPGC